MVLHLSLQDELEEYSLRFEDPKAWKINKSNDET